MTFVILLPSLETLCEPVVSHRLALSKHALPTVPPSNTPACGWHQVQYWLFVHPTTTTAYLWADGSHFPEDLSVYLQIIIKQMHK